MDIKRWVCAVCLMTGALVMRPAAAQYATGGEGLYRSNILWFDWGDNGTAIPQVGDSISNTTLLAGQPLRVTCALSNISGPEQDPDLRIYRPGDYWEDSLPSLYSIDGLPDPDTGNTNTMDIGLMHRAPYSSATFTFSCSATLAGAPYVIDGLVFADAETTNEDEFIRTTLPAGSTMRVIERYRQPGCTTGYQVSRTGEQYEFTSMSPYSCYEFGGPSAMGVYFLENATSATVTFGSSGGLQAIALGVMLNVADFGDAPDTYGEAVHLPQFNWTGGVVLPGNTNIFESSFDLASPVMPPTALLGQRVDVEVAPQYSADASGDDGAGQISDEDGVDVPSLAPLLVGRRGLIYTVPVTCVGSAPVAGWIDFDRNEVFDDDERSGTVNCVAGAASLTWTIPNDISAGSSFLRVRTAVLAAQILSPMGVAGSGEVEDYALPIHDPAVVISKTTLGKAGGPFTFTTTSTVSQPEPLSTVAAGTAVASERLSILDLANALVVSELQTTEGWSLMQLNCTNTAAVPPLSATVDLDAKQVTIAATSLSPAADIACSFTNELRANLVVTKTNTPGQGPLDQPTDSVVAGSGTNYIIVVSNQGPGMADGALIADVPEAGLVCGTVVCTESGGATCPATGSGPGELSIANLQAGQVVVPVLPMGGQLSFNLSCQVQ